MIHQGQRVGRCQDSETRNVATNEQFNITISAQIPKETNVSMPRCERIWTAGSNIKLMSKVFNNNMSTSKACRISWIRYMPRIATIQRGDDLNRL